jgi:hypothetical protein
MVNRAQWFSNDDTVETAVGVSAVTGAVTTPQLQEQLQQWRRKQRDPNTRTLTTDTECCPIDAS